MKKLATCALFIVAIISIAMPKIDTALGQTAIYSEACRINHQVSTDSSGTGNLITVGFAAELDVYDSSYESITVTNQHGETIEMDLDRSETPNDNTSSGERSNTFYFYDPNGQPNDVYTIEANDRLTPNNNEYLDGEYLPCQGSETATNPQNPNLDCDNPNSSGYASPLCNWYRGGIPDNCGSAEDYNKCRIIESCKDSSGNVNTTCAGARICEQQQQNGYTYTRFFPGGLLAGEDDVAGGCYKLDEFIKQILNYVMLLGTIVATFIFVWGGYKYLASRGDPTRLAEAKDMILQSIIGLVILGMALAIISFLSAGFQGVSEGINLEWPF